MRAVRHFPSHWIQVLTACVFTACLFTACLCTTEVAAAGFGPGPDELPVADMDIQPSLVTWQPLVSEAIGLTVSGPDGVHSVTFDEGTMPFFDIVDDTGALRPDGSYTFQLVALPDVDTPGFGDSFNGRSGELDPSEIPPLHRQSGSFMICEGSFADPDLDEGGAGFQVPSNPDKDFNILNDLIVDGSACVGFDCVDGESFGFDTLRLKENNLRIKFEDTSTSGSFPSNDWQITVNDSTNGSLNKFSIDDIDGGRTPFTIEAGAPSHSLYVDLGGSVGFGTSTPVVEIHTRSGDTPSARLEQDGSKGFKPHVWDIAGNEVSFFVRDASNGSKLPFRIRPKAPTNAIVLAEGGVGMGTNWNPTEDLHVMSQDGNTKVLIEEGKDADGTYTLLELKTSGREGEDAKTRPRFTMTHGGLNAAWNFDVLNNGDFAFIRSGGGSVFTFTDSGDLQIQGDFVSSGTTLNVPDYVFAEDYHLMPLDDVKAFIEQESHLPHVPSASEIVEDNFNLTDMQLTLLRKVEELTLYTLDQHTAIQDQQEVIRQNQETIAALQRLTETQQELIEQLLAQSND